MGGAVGEGVELDVRMCRFQMCRLSEPGLNRFRDYQDSYKHAVILNLFQDPTGQAIRHVIHPKYGVPKQVRHDKVLKKRNPRNPLILKIKVQTKST
jgi:hypothetical protein